MDWGLAIKTALNPLPIALTGFMFMLAYQLSVTPAVLPSPPAEQREAK